MKAAFLGDSYDIVKQSLLRWLASMGHWATHPMFSETIAHEQAATLSRLLGTRLLSDEALTPTTDRSAYLAVARNCTEHVFLDPDTGIRIAPNREKKAPLYLFGPELVAIAEARPELLTLVFDQSLARGREREQLERKLVALASHGLHGVAYVSHACFVLVGMNGALVNNALDILKRESSLPESRFVRREPQNNQMQRTRSASASVARAARR